MKAEAAKLGDIDVIESDGQVSSPKQTADIEAAHHPGRQRHRHQPERGRRDGAGAAGGGRRRAFRSSPSTGGSTRSRASSPMSAPTTSRAARPRAKLIMKLFPNGATIINLQGQPGAEPGDRPQQGPAQRPRHGDGQVQDRLRADRRLRPRQGPGGDRSRRSPAWPTPPDVIVAANDDMALGAMEALKARNLTGKVAIIGFDALPEALAAGPRRRPDRHHRAVPRRPEPRRRRQRWSPSCATAPSRPRR